MTRSFVILVILLHFLPVISTAQERTDAFVLGSYKFTDNLTGFVNAFYNHTHSSGQDAPAPTGVGDGWYVLASNPINPFGVTFSSGSSGSAYPVHIIFGIIGQIKIYYYFDIAYINTASCNVGCSKHAILSIFKTFQCFAALAERAV